MKLSSGRVRVLAAAVAGCGAVAAIVAAGAGSATAAPGSSSVALVNCKSDAVVKPLAYLLTCADGGDDLQGLHWVSWSGVAFATGTEFLNDCYPNCASGRFYHYPVLITAWRAEPWPGHHGRQYFTRLTEIRTGSRTFPHNQELALTETWDLGPHGGA
jgi:hypothetical protein